MINVRRLEKNWFLVRIDEDSQDDLFWEVAEEVIELALREALALPDQVVDLDDDVPF